MEVEMERQHVNFIVQRLLNESDVYWTVHHFDN